MINEDLKNRKISLLQKNLSYLKQIAGNSERDYLKDFKTRYASRHLILESTQICIDIAFHLCIINELGEPENYKDAFQILQINNLISSDIAKKMQNWAGLRNLITHIYEKIDDKRIFFFIQSDLSDFSLFLDEINLLREF